MESVSRPYLESESTILSGVRVGGGVSKILPTPVQSPMRGGWGGGDGEEGG